MGTCHSKEAVAAAAAAAVAAAAVAAAKAATDPRSGRLRLSVTELLDADRGNLFAKFDDVFEFQPVSFDGAFEELAKLRQGTTGTEPNAPKEIRELANVCAEVWEHHQQNLEKARSQSNNEGEVFIAERERKKDLRRRLKAILDDVLTETASVFSPQPREASAPPSPSSESGRSERTDATHSVGSRDLAPDILGERLGGIHSRAHLMPANPACRVFWGPVCEMLSGFKFDSDDSDEKKMYVRREMTDYVGHFKCNFVHFRNQHELYFDCLSAGCIMIIPLLSLEEIGQWKRGKGYEALVVCDSKEAQKFVGGFCVSDEIRPHLKWESEGDATKAATVLEAFMKGQADSLLTHKESYYDKVTVEHEEFADKKKETESARSSIKNNENSIGVPRLKKKRRQSQRHKKFFKIDFGILFPCDTTDQRKDLSARIPDPGVLASKASANASSLALTSPSQGEAEHLKEDQRNVKLLPCPSPKEDDSSFLSMGPTKSRLEEGLFNFMAEQKGLSPEQYAIELYNAIPREIDTDLLNREIEFNVVSDSEDEELSSIGSLTETHGIVVSNDSP